MYEKQVRLLYLLYMINYNENESEKYLAKILHKLI